MKPFVLMNKKTGDLFLGYRITFLDKSEAYTGPWGMVQIGVFEHDGWVVQLPPDEFPYPMYFNRECEKLFDVLGEL